MALKCGAAKLRTAARRVARFVKGFVFALAAAQPAQGWFENQYRDRAENGSRKNARLRRSVNFAQFESAKFAEQKPLIQSGTRVAGKPARMLGHKKKITNCGVVETCEEERFQMLDIGCWIPDIQHLASSISGGETNGRQGIVGSDENQGGAG